MEAQTQSKTKEKKVGKQIKPETKAMVTKPEPGAVAAFSPQEWGAPALTARDISIPKIYAMQPMSKLVTAGTNKFGDLIDSLTGEVLGNEKQPIEFVPFYMEKVFVVMAPKNGKFEFVRTEKITAANEDHEYEVNDDNGRVIERWYRTLNFYTLLPKDIEKGGEIPYVISFRSSSAKGGQRLATQMFMKNSADNRSPAATVMKLTAAKKTNDKGTFIVLDVATVRDAQPNEEAAAFKWVKTVLKGQVKVDNSDLEAEANSEAAVNVSAESNEF